MPFNPDKNKQVQEVVFSQKQFRPEHHQLIDTCCLLFLSKAPSDFFREKTKLYKSHQGKNMETRYILELMMLKV